MRSTNGDTPPTTKEKKEQDECPFPFLHKDGAGEGGSESRAHGATQVSLRPLDTQTLFTRTDRRTRVVYTWTAGRVSSNTASSPGETNRPTMKLSPRFASLVMRLGRIEPE